MPQFTVHSMLLRVETSPPLSTRVQIFPQWFVLFLYGTQLNGRTYIYLDVFYRTFQRTYDYLKQISVRAICVVSCDACPS